ncbi:MAG: hypothetical protein K0S65_843 [Labilithrix sp.]|nr:hypothetical protein [Labilithrix sp.]
MFARWIERFDWRFERTSSERELWASIESWRERDAPELQVKLVEDTFSGLKHIEAIHHDDTNRKLLLSRLLDDISHHTATELLGPQRPDFSIARQPIAAARALNGDYDTRLLDRSRSSCATGRPTCESAGYSLPASRALRNSFLSSKARSKRSDRSVFAKCSRRRSLLCSDRELGNQRPHGFSFSRMTSTRRLFARPSAVALSAFG